MINAFAWVEITTARPLDPMLGILDEGFSFFFVLFFLEGEGGK